MEQFHMLGEYWAMKKKHTCTLFFIYKNMGSHFLLLHKTYFEGNFSLI